MTQAPTPTARVVTLSATYGSGGSVIAPRLASALGMTFEDRVISPPTAAALESLTDEERESTPPSRWLSALARVAAMVPSSPIPMEGDADPVQDLRRRNEEHIGAALARGEALFLGRGAALALAKLPNAYHIRLDGPAERRIARAMAIEHTALDDATARCAATDRARDHFVRRLYNADPASPQHYHLVLDSTVLSTDAVVEVLITAAEHFWALRRLMPTERTSWRGDDYQARFDRLAASGADVHGEADLVAGYAPGAVLDAGCGSGRVAIELARRGIDVVGVDVDESMLATAARLAPSLTWVHSDLADLDLGRTFDVVVMAGNVPLFTPAGTQPALVAGVARHVRPGGVLIAGFSLGRGYSVGDYDRDCRAAGLELQSRWSSWDRGAWGGSADYAVSVHQDAT